MVAGQDTKEHLSPDTTERHEARDIVQTSDPVPVGELEWLLDSLRHQTWILGYLPLGMCLVYEGRLCYANRRFAEILGFTDGPEVCGRNLADFLQGDASQLYLDALKAGMTTNSPITLGPMNVVRTDGEITAISMSVRTLKLSKKTIGLAVVSDALPNQANDSHSSLQLRQASKLEVAAEDGKSGLFNHFMRNVDGLTALNSKQNESNELARSIVEQAQDLFFAKDLELRYTMVNPAMERLHRRSASPDFDTFFRQVRIRWWNGWVWGEGLECSAPVKSQHANISVFLQKKCQSQEHRLGFGNRTFGSGHWPDLRGLSSGDEPSLANELPGLRHSGCRCRHRNGSSEQKPRIYLANQERSGHIRPDQAINGAK